MIRPLPPWVRFGERVRVGLGRVTPDWLRLFKPRWLSVGFVFSNGVPSQMGSSLPSSEAVRSALSVLMDCLFLLVFPFIHNFEARSVRPGGLRSGSASLSSSRKIGLSGDWPGGVLWKARLAQFRARAGFRPQPFTSTTTVPVWRPVLAGKPGSSRCPSDSSDRNLILLW